MKITIAHINDTHSHFDPTSTELTVKVDNQVFHPYVNAGGFGRIATRAAQLKQDALKNDQHFLFLHAGDCFQGTLYFSLFKGLANSDLLNALNLDAMTLGNHELDMGNQPVADFAQRINFPLLAGNWDLSQECQSKSTRLSENSSVYSFDTEKQIARWIVKGDETQQVAIFGLSIDKMSDIASPDSDTPFVNAIETAKNTVQAIQQSGINNIILLSHLGYDGDFELAKQVDGIALIIGGHSHRLQGDFEAIGLGKDDEYGIRVNGTHIVQAGCHSMAIGRCEVEFNQSGEIISFSGTNEILIGKRVFHNASLEQEFNAEKIAQVRRAITAQPNVVVCKRSREIYELLDSKYRPRVKKLQTQPLYQLQRNLRHVRVPDELGGSEVAPLVAESFRYAMCKLGHDVDFGLHNAGGVRVSLKAGQLTMGDIVGRLLPFAIPVVVYKIKGQDLAAALEGAINNALNNGVEGTGQGSYPYLSRVQFDYIHDNPTGSRISNLMIKDRANGWSHVVADQIYCGVSSVYTAKGKEGYDALLNYVEEPIVSNQSMADCFIEWLRDQDQGQQNACLDSSFVTGTLIAK